MDLTTFEKRFSGKVVIDSRRASEQSLFFALAGAKTDGHLHLEDARQRGAAAAVVKKGYRGAHCDLDLFFVDDPLATLQDLARERLLALNPLKIGITGSLGKTSTKEFLAQILSAQFSVGKNMGSYNGQLGLPLTILNTDKVEILILEMGINQIGEMARLVQIAPIDIAIVTDISRSHIGNFTSLNHLAAEKGTMLSSPNFKWGVAGPTARRYAPFAHLEARDPLFYTPFSVKHMNENVALAVHVARRLGMPEAEIARVVSTLQPVEHRFCSIWRNGVLFIDDSFNASFTSIAAALKSLPAGRRRIAILSEMVEMGPCHEEEHRKVGLYAKNILDELLVLGKEGGAMIIKACGKGRLFTDFQALKEAMETLVQEGDVVLIKGAHKYALWRLVEGYS